MLPAGYRLLRFDDIDSTSSQARRLARQGEAGDLWVAATRQSAGRGRQGRPWVSEPGNFYASVLLNAACAPPMAATLSFVAALALHQAIVGLAPRLAPALRLKWPNDVLCGGAKIAGILLESEARAPDATSMVVGFGVNCAHHPEDAGYPVTDLTREGAPITPNALLARLAERFAANRALWADGTGFAAIRREWLERAAGVGGPVSVRGRSGALDGIFETLDHDGALVLRRGAERRRIAAGDVFLQE